MRSLFTSAAIATVITCAPAFAEPETETGETETELEPYFGRLTPFYGRLTPFEGDVNPFWGRLTPFEGDPLNPFWGRITPFEGDIESFWGRLTPFAEGDELAPFWGRITPFWGRISPFMGDLQAQWGRITPFDEAAAGDHEAVINLLKTIVSESETFWGERVTKATGASFWDGFAAKVFADFGIDLDDPSSLDGFTDGERAAFLFAWYDGLMNFSGMDRVDHWMETANWSPSLTQIQGMGTDTVIGLIDFSMTADADLKDNLISWSGNQDPAGGHGGAVASLLVADHDGKGLMGIAPGASVALYNPFDEDGTANWTSVTKGVIAVGEAGASVVNLSLGVPGSTFDAEWATVYGHADVQPYLGKTVYVHAAGNEGIEQASDINLELDVDPTLIVVGSIGPNRTISAFSNTPGDACLVAKNSAQCDVYLKDRFIVAPGEWILVTDGEGGVTRMSGTSFAAPIVTGAIALLHDRWGWLKQHPGETADIIFQTADDLGAPGVDEVYGHGALNITASQSPIDFDMLYQLSTDKQGRTTKNYIAQLDENHVGALLSTDDGYLTVLEDVGETYRDFLIPLEEILVGLGYTVNGEEEMLQTYLTEGFNSLGSVGTSTKGKKVKTKLAGVTMDMQTFALPLIEQQRQGGLPVASEFSLTSDEGVTFAFGNGVGAMALTGDASTAKTRFDPVRGGVNPVLGLASGGGFARVEMPVAGNATFSVGTTGRSFEDGYTDPRTGEWLTVNRGVPTYEASATYASVSQPLSETATLSVAYTRLAETDGALGTQSSLNGAFSGGTTTDAFTLGSSWTVSDRVSLSGSATFGETRSNDALAGLAIGQDGIQTTAFEAAVSFNGVFGESDQARIALVQPMHIETGAFSVTGMQVTDRTSGALQQATSEFQLADERIFAVEAGWGTRFLEGTGSIAGFVRLEANNEGQFGGGEHVGGLKLGLSF